MVLFSRGKTEDKLRIIFDMCDNDRNGVIDKGELSEMLRSLVEIARTTSLSDEHVTELIDGMFQVNEYTILIVLEFRCQDGRAVGVNNSRCQTLREV